MAEEQVSPQEKIRDANREMVQAIKDKSDDDFEKNLIYITSGTLVLSLTFIEKIAPLSSGMWVLTLILAWFLLAVSLLINLVSHQKASKYSLQYIQEYGEGKSEEEINNLIIKNNKKISTMNNWAVGLLVAGIGFLIVYCSINAYKMSNEKKSENIVKPSDISSVKNGRQTSTMIVQRPAPTNPPPKDSETKK